MLQPAVRNQAARILDVQRFFRTTVGLALRANPPAPAAHFYGIPCSLRVCQHRYVGICSPYPSPPSATPSAFTSGAAADRHLHVRHADDKAWHELEGELTFRYAGRSEIAGPGATVSRPDVVRFVSILSKAGEMQWLKGEVEGARRPARRTVVRAGPSPRELIPAWPVHGYHPSGSPSGSCRPHQREIRRVARCLYLPRPPWGEALRTAGSSQPWDRREMEIYTLGTDRASETRRANPR